MAEKQGARERPANVLDYIDRLNILRHAHMYHKKTAAKLHFRQLPILAYIDAHPCCTQNELAQAMGLTPSSIALSTKRLEKSGYLCKQTDEQNLRCKRLQLTDAGRAAHRAAYLEAEAFYRQLTQGIDRERLLLVQETLGQMICNLSGECRVGFFENIALLNASVPARGAHTHTQKEDDTL